MVISLLECVVRLGDCQVRRVDRHVNDAIAEDVACELPKDASRSQDARQDTDHEQHGERAIRSTGGPVLLCLFVSLARYHRVLLFIPDIDYQYRIDNQ